MLFKERDEIQRSIHAEARRGEQQKSDGLLCTDSNGKKHKEGELRPFTEQYEGTAQIYRYKIKKVKGGWATWLSRDIKGNIL